MKMLIVFMLLVICSDVCAAPDKWCREKEFQISTKLGPQKFYDRSCALILTASSYEKYGDAWENIDNEGEADNFQLALTRIGFDVLRVPHVKSKNFERMLNEFCTNNGTKDARLLIYFSGHGFTATDGSLVGYIIPEDAVDDQSDYSKFKSQAVSTHQILKISNSCKAKHLMFILDSCFSAALFKTKSKALTAGSLPSAILVDDLGRRTRQFLTSTDARTTSPERSVFTPALISGINGAAEVSRVGLVTGRSLGLWVREQVSSSEETPTVPQFGDVNSELGGDFIFVASSKKTNNTSLKAIVDEARSGYFSAFKGIDLVYYRKAADGEAVMAALENAGIPFVATKNNRNPESFRTNTIACHRSGNIKAVKLLAKVMIESGIDVMEVIAFQEHGGKPSNRVELLNDARFSYGRAEPLSLDQIEDLKECPRLLANRIVEK